MEYMVLAYKGNSKTYCQSLSLDQAFDFADELKSRGWKIEGILAMEIKEDFTEDYENIKLMVKELCYDYKKKTSDGMKKEQVLDIKRKIIDRLDKDGINTRDAQYYIERMIDNYLGWDETTDIIANYIEKKLENCYMK